MSTAEIDPSCLYIIKKIGEGCFGDVHLGTMRMNGECKRVAVKTPKQSATATDLADFKKEADIMGQFKHPNVIRLLGVVRMQPAVPYVYMIVTEYMRLGSLDKLLQNNIGTFTVVRLLEMMSDIASGMLYLSKKNYVHRDLAARNILVDSSLCCKVADFGLSRWKDFDGVYTSKGVNISVRWTALEAIANKTFTSASDVWSFGIGVWEIMSYGDIPYGKCSNAEVIWMVSKGIRLPQPSGCPLKLYQLMCECWHANKDLRPSFSTIVETLKDITEEKILESLKIPDLPC